jgi:hypothetical protein
VKWPPARNKQKQVFWDKTRQAANLTKPDICPPVVALVVLKIVETLRPSLASALTTNAGQTRGAWHRRHFSGTSHFALQMQEQTRNPEKPRKLEKLLINHVLKMSGFWWQIGAQAVTCKTGGNRRTALT